MKTLKQLLELKKPEVPTPSQPVEPDSVTSYVPKAKDEKRFMDKHIVKKTDDVNGNGDDHFRATNVKVHDRSKGHGYNRGEDIKVYEEKQVKTLNQILGEKKLTPNEMAKREDIAKGIEKSDPGMAMGKKMAIATAKAKQVAEETLVESEEAHAQYMQYHSDAKKMLDKIGKGLDTHAKHVSTKGSYHSGTAHWGHVGDMKHFHRQLQDMHDNLNQQGEYAKPPKAIKMKEEAEGLFDVFAEDVRSQVEAVYESLDDEHKQIMIEMIEAEDYDTIIEVVKETTNG